MENKKLIIDRFEEDQAVIEYGDIIFDIPRDVLPKESKEGSVIRIIVESSKHIDKYDNLFEKC